MTSNLSTSTTLSAHDEEMTGAEMVVRALVDQGVEVLFGYPGGAVLPIYDALLGEPRLRHILVRHEQGAAHAAEGYARSSGKPGVVLVTSGPGAINTVVGIVDALMDSIPLIVITGQVPTHLIGTDAFQEADTIGITRSCTKHSYLVRNIEDLPRVMHEAYRIATTGRPGPVVIDIPKDVQVARGRYIGPRDSKPLHVYEPQTKGNPASVAEAVRLLSEARRPIFYTGGGIINSGPRASRRLREFAALVGAPVTSTLMGLGAFPASDPSWLGMPGMHGAYEANHAMHDCDVMLCIGARFDDRVTGRLDAFSPGSRKIHVDIDPSSIGKTVPVDVGIIGDASSVLEDLIAAWPRDGQEKRNEKLAPWWLQINNWRAGTQSLQVPQLVHRHQAAIRPGALASPDA
ncbi:Acetolactate synthase large subunit (plasmid) [Rhizobium favelukesii]|uniref:Acetolactate synthase large subunit n=1 Tax=Rhizobium favelukesii TaxID=348824 RepID=W6RR44_9HYPH|nr:Acetolactate synthase large subunit [Rhizobium favelukesii]